MGIGTADSNSVADENQRVYRDYDEQLQSTRQRALRYDSFFRGRQYTRKEKRLLKNAGLIPLVVNVVRPLLSNRRAIITSSKSTWKVVPLQGGNKVVADAAQQFLVGKWNADYTDTQLNLALKDMLIVGYGYLLIDKASFLDNATFDIKIERLHWRYVYPDPTFKNYDGSDAENFLLRKLVGVKRAQVLYRLTEEQAKAAIYDATHAKSGNTPSTQEVEVLDRFSKYPVIQHAITPKKGEHLRDLPTVFYTSTLEDSIEKEKRDLADEMERLSVSGQVQLNKMKDLHIYRAISAGATDIYHGLMAIKDYPVIPFIDEFGNTFLEAQGETEFIEGIQRAVNKFYSLTLHNAMLQGNYRVMGPANAVKNKTQFQRTSAIPGAYLPYDPDPTLPDGGRPQILQAGSLPAAFYSLSQDLIEKAKFETSAYDPVLGNSKGSPETFSTVASLQDFGTQSIKEVARRVDIQIAKAGEVALQFIQNYTEKNELLQFVDIENGELTSPMSETEGVKVPIILNEVVIKEGVVSEIKNNTRLGKYSVKVMTQPNFGTDRLAKAAFIRDMLMNKAIPATPPIIAMLLDLMEFPNSNKIIDQMKAEMGSAEKLQQMEKQLEDAGKMVKNLQSENMKLNKRVELESFKTELEKILNNVELKGKDVTNQILSQVSSLIESGSNGKGR